MGYVFIYTHMKTIVLVIQLIIGTEKYDPFYFYYETMDECMDAQEVIVRRYSSKAVATLCAPIGTKV